MLVLSRKVGDKIRINENIVVTVLKCQGSTVRIGVEAPADVKILRAELPPLPGCAPTAALAPKQPALRLTGGAAHRQRFVETNATATPRSTATPGSNRSDVAGSASHPHRWSVASMRERAQSAVAARSVNDSANRTDSSSNHGRS